MCVMCVCVYDLCVSDLCVYDLCVCVKHLNRCKTSAVIVFSCDLLLFIFSVSSSSINLLKIQQGVPGALMRPALTKTLISCP